MFDEANYERRTLMQCPRCGGLMVSDRLQDIKDSTGHLHFLGARCLVCGEILDAKIIENREKQRVFPLV